MSLDRESYRASDSGTPNRSWWPLILSTTASLAVLVPALLFGNILPWINQLHGWPLTYMERGFRAGSYFYGPWPLFNPPLVTFLPAALAFNVLAGVALLVGASVSGAYWLKLRSKPLQFGLRGLLGFTAAVCVALVLYRVSWYVSGGWWFMIPFTRGVLHAAAFGVFVTAVHAMINASTRRRRNPRWLGLHAVTWLALFVAGGPYLHYSFLFGTGRVEVENEDPNVRGVLSLEGYGWPDTYRAHFRAGLFGWGPAVPYPGFPTYYFDAAALGLDIALAVIVLLSITLVVERWVRRTEQQLPAHLVWVIPYIAAAILALLISNYDFSFHPRWYDYWSWFFSVACVPFVLGWLCLVALPRVLKNKPSKFADLL